MKHSKIAIAMSGGVDSSVTAALLKEQGYDVVGVTMRVVRPAAEERHIADARKVAEGLGIRHEVVDLVDVFEREVIQPFCDQYKNGLTPSPCTWCNPGIKFGALFERVWEFGADALATGHYVRVKQGEGRYFLSRAEDDTKDQTYFLFALTQKQLSRFIAPLGDIRKTEVRELARKYNLPVSEKKDSHEVCFVPPDTSCGEFVSKKLETGDTPGPILDESGKQVGVHRGLHHYTIGQRKGLGIALGEPAYVVALDSKRNSVVVGKNETLFETTMQVGDFRFMKCASLVVGETYHAKIRYLAPPATCRLARVDQDRYLFEFDEHQRAITPGQAAVFYDSAGDVLGGGWLDSVV